MQLNLINNVYLTKLIKLKIHYVFWIFHSYPFQIRPSLSFKGPYQLVKLELGLWVSWRRKQG